MLSIKDYCSYFVVVVVVVAVCLLWQVEKTQKPSSSVLRERQEKGGFKNGRQAKIEGKNSSSK